MIHLVLDTNILHQGLWSKNMYQLTSLINAGHLTLYIPTFVEKEYITSIVGKVEEKVESNRNNFRSIRSEFAKLRRDKPVSFDPFASISSLNNGNLLNKSEKANESLIVEIRKAITT